MSKRVTVIGGANVDISANLTEKFLHGDSIPGNVAVGFGGVAHNIALNLALLGNDVRFITAFGSDSFGNLALKHCADEGLDISLAKQFQDRRNGVYLCINDLSGDMIAAVADTDSISEITPEFLSERITEINSSVAVVIDTNLTTEALQFIFENCTPPVFIDAVSTTKAKRMVEALCNAKSHGRIILKLNKIEAQVITGENDMDAALKSIHEMGVSEIFLTIGADGVICSDQSTISTYPAIPVDVINTTGAGDAFLAGVVHDFLIGNPFPETALCGLKAAYATLLSPSAVNPDIKKFIQ